MPPGPMSRALIIFGLIALTLGGCSQIQPEPSPSEVEPVSTNYTQLQDWVRMQNRVSYMPPEEVIAELALLNQPDDPRQLFYYSLLNQQLDIYASWIRARDAQRILQQDNRLTREQQQLAQILERYNQSRINWYQQHRSLLQKYETVQAELIAADQENQLLRDKIQALTELETTISTRREQ